MKILVTGGAGFIGSAVCREIITATGHSVANVDKLTYAANLDSLAEISSDSRYSFHQVDICDRSLIDRVIEDEQPDAILCPDGASAPGNNNYSWDSVSLTGNASIFSNGACGAEPESIAIPFALTKTGSGPVQYPTAPVQIEPYVVDIPEPYVPGAAEAPPVSAPAPVETDPALKATPEVIPNTSDPLTEADVAQPGFNR